VRGGLHPEEVGEAVAVDAHHDGRAGCETDLLMVVELRPISGERGKGGRGTGGKSKQGRPLMHFLLKQTTSPAGSFSND
jgi:hypothetical protein